MINEKFIDDEHFTYKILDKIKILFYKARSFVSMCLLYYYDPVGYVDALILFCNKCI